jgi:hypothetical protein
MGAFLECGYGSEAGMGGSTLVSGGELTRRVAIPWSGLGLGRV